MTLTAVPVPAHALTEWRTLTAALQRHGPAPCEGPDPDAWWPAPKHTDNPRTQGAIASCEACPARLPCLDYAVVAGEREGLWGGMLPVEREAMRRSAA